MDRSRDDNVHEILFTISQVGSKWGAWTSPTQPGFCPQNEITFRQLAAAQRPIFTKFGHDTWMSLETYRIRFSNNFPFSDVPKTWKLQGSNKYLTQISLQPTGRTSERYSSIVHPYVVVQRPRSFPVRLTFCTTYGFAVTGRQVSPKFAFLPIFLKRLKYSFVRGL